ncbi:histidine-specific methyltransferase [Russula compacta]|nr:histidine-specific methyltransferase [Russula compacta]
MSARIIDVRLNNKASNGAFNIRDEIIEGLSHPVDQKNLPSLLLWDEEGLLLYDKVTTTTDEYYPFAAEENILRRHADDIIKIMQGRHQSEDYHPLESVVVELGSGALRKTSHILSAFSKTVPPQASHAPIIYYALDLERRELERTLDELAASPVGLEMHGKINTFGLWGTYEGGLKFIGEGGLRGREAVPTAAIRAQCDEATTKLSSPPSTQDRRILETPLHLLFLGSSLGNFSRGDDATFLRSLPLRVGKGDTLLIGLDHTMDAAKVQLAYNDPAGINRRFVLNGLKAAGRVLGDESLFAPDKWDHGGRFNAHERRHEAFYRSRIAQTIRDPQTQVDFTFVADERVSVVASHKYSERDAYRLFSDGNLRPLRRWTDPNSGYSLWLVERPPFNFQLLRSPASTSSNTPFAVPTLQEFEESWAAWDFITSKMIPDSMLFEKPIHLRDIFLFYIGHIPTFLDIHLSNLLGEPNTEPEHYKYLFERGIDRNVDDLAECYPHSEVPERDEDWPSHSAILDFQRRVRARLSNLYAELDSGRRPLTRKLARVLFMTLEHEAFHTETLLFMLIQHAGTGTVPQSVSGFTTPCWESLAEAWDAAPEPSSATITLGPATVELGHDDLKASDASLNGKDHRHRADVGEFRIEWRPITNSQFHEYWKTSEGKVPMPKSWVVNDGNVMVRTIYGPVPMKIAQHWPVVTDYDSVSSYATVRGGRLPTEGELLLFYSTFENDYEGGRNVGFRNWHPVP